jgi:ATP-dependent RNA helicase DOB1
VIYTAPIKALSNQKYRELKEAFGDVGLITCDVSINPSASCLVMATEVLRLMLYCSLPLIRELSWVICDEIHYMQDVKCGAVWKNRLFCCRMKFDLLFIGKIPNARESSEWIAQIHKQNCHMVYTEFRSVLLEYFLAPPKKPIFRVRKEDAYVDEEQIPLAHNGISIDHRLHNDYSEE